MIQLFLRRGCKFWAARSIPAHLLELLQLNVPEHDETVLARGKVALVHPGPGASVHRPSVAGGAPVHPMGLDTRVSVLNSLGNSHCASFHSGVVSLDRQDQPNVEGNTA